MSFSATWIAAFIAIALATVVVGLRLPKSNNPIASPGWSSVFIDNRGRYSLNRLQVVVWTALVFATFIAIAVQGNLSEASNIDPELLMLIGISGASVTLAGAIKDSKNSTTASRIAGVPQFHAAMGVTAEPEKEMPSHPMQMILEEEGVGADKVVSVSKFQNLIVLIALSVVFVNEVLSSGGQGAYPEIGRQVAWLSGISHGTYLGGKITPKQ